MRQSVNSGLLNLLRRRKYSCIERTDIQENLLRGECKRETGDDIEQSIVEFGCRFAEEISSLDRERWRAAVNQPFGLITREEGEEKDLAKESQIRQDK